MTEWDLVCSNSYLISIFQSTFLIGYSIGLFIFGILSDIYGRKLVLLITWPVMLAGLFGMAYAPNILVACLMRTLYGIVAAGQWLAVFVTIMEMTIPARRNMMAIMISLSWPITGLCVAALGYFFRNWRNLELIAVAPMALALPILIFLPESARWLITKNRLSEAKRILNRAAKINQRELSNNIDLSDLYKKHQLEHEKKISGLVLLLSLLRTPELRKRTLVLSIQWFTACMVFYGITFYGTNVLPGDPYVKVAALSALRFIGYFPQVWILNRLGSKNTTMMFLLATVVPMFITVFLTGKDSAVNILAIIAAAFGLCFIDAAFGAVYIFTGELYPTSLRQSGFGFNSIMGRVGAFMAPFIANMLGGYWRPLPVIIFAVVCLVSVLFLPLLPSMKDKALPDSVEDVEGNMEEKIKLQSTGVSSISGCSPSDLKNK